MYSRGSNAYGQQSYSAQSGYGQNLGSGYSGDSVGGADKASQVSIANRHSSLLGGSQEAEISGYRAGPASHYGGQYSSVYGSASSGNSQQIPAMIGVGSAPLEVRGNFSSTLPESPKYASAYVSSSHAYTHSKSDQLFSENVSDYPSTERRQYGERQNTFLPREMPSEPTGRYVASGFASQHQHELYDRIDPSSLLRQQLLKAQAFQPSSIDEGGRQADYLASRGAAARHQSQDLASYGGRMEANPRNLSMINDSSYGGKHTPSILGAVPPRNLDDLTYSQSSSNPKYGVSLPLGRDYAMGKGLRGASLESEYPGSILSRGGHSMVDERKDDRGGYVRELELREEEHRRERLREREREREKERDQSRDRDRVRDRDRERERERERERDRVKGRERERLLERHIRDRDRDRRLETKAERTPLRISRDRGGSALVKDGRTSRLDSPHREALHRRYSPVKEKQRDYVCKVYSSSLVEVERDYLAIDKRYPRLFITPEFSKVVVNWPKENIKLSLHTPVSFEHYFVEETLPGQNESEMKPPSDGPEKPGMGHTVWNAKVILMSGLSKNALEELSSERNSNDRIPHICNILRFALLKKDHSIMAIGGPWDNVDGEDPSLDCSSLVQTALRYAKDLAQIDLQNCHHWNPFLEIHYERVGKDGLFSHKEITVLFAPDLSECLPSLDSWREQWLAHKKFIAERDSQLSVKKESSTDKEMQKVEGDSLNVKRVDRSDTKKDASLETAVDQQGREDSKENIAVVEEATCKKELETKDVNMSTGQVETAERQTVSSVKPGKKRIVKRIVKQKVGGKKMSVDNSSDKKDDKTNVEDVGQENVDSQTPGKQGETLVKTFVRRKVTKKDSVKKSVDKEGKVMVSQVETEPLLDASEEKPKSGSDANNIVAVKDPNAKVTKKKIIKRVPKRKLSAVVSSTQPVECDNDDGNPVKVDNIAEQVEVGVDAVDSVKQVEKSKQKMKPKTKSKTVSAEKGDNAENVSTMESMPGKEVKVEEKGIDARSSSVIRDEVIPCKDNVCQKDNNSGMKEKERLSLKDGKEKKDRSRSDELKGKSGREAKEKKKIEEPPRHPGLFLQIKGSKDSKFRSLSLSLDSLMDYTDRDIDESSFELSLFAESLYEMLQYQMGCRLLTFLQKVRIKFFLNRSQRKRQREETDKENEKKSSIKRQKNDDPSLKIVSAKSEFPESSREEAEKCEGKGAAAVGIEKKKPIDEIKSESSNGEANVEDGLEEDPEEDPAEEDEEIPILGSQLESAEKENEEGNIQTEDHSGPEQIAESEKNESSKISKESHPKANKIKVGSETKEALSIDKEALQAFRFFDRNRCGYLRVEDLRLIIHNLGKFLSHRDVKELVQSALLESNTGRDDRILYDKLVRVTPDD